MTNSNIKKRTIYGVGSHSCCVLEQVVFNTSTKNKNLFYFSKRTIRYQIRTSQSPYGLRTWSLVFEFHSCCALVRPRKSMFKPEDHLAYAVIEFHISLVFTKIVAKSIYLYLLLNKNRFYFSKRTIRYQIRILQSPMVFGHGH